MRGRWLKPEFVKDKKMGQLGLAAAIVYQTLWCMSDDGGVARGAAEEIKGEMLVWWDELDVPAVRSALEKLEASGRISGYVIGDHQYWTLHNLLKHQGKIHKPAQFRHPRPNKPGVGAGSVPGEDSTPPYLDASTPQHFNTSSPDTASAASAAFEDSESLGATARALITRLNQGMQDNPEIGNAMTPVPHGHGSSITAVEEIVRAGVPLEFASSVVYEGAKRYKPAGRNRQIKSLGYLTASVLDAWEQHNALSTASSTSRPAGAPRVEHRSVRGKTLAATKLISYVRSKRNPQFPQSVLPEWDKELDPSDREIVKAFGIPRILNDPNEGTLVSQLAKALEEAA